VVEVRVSRVVCAITGVVLALGTLQPAFADTTPTDSPASVTPTPTHEAADGPTAIHEAREQGVRIEDLSQRTETTQVFANPDSTWTREDSAEPVRAKDDQGNWHDLDTTLVERDGTVEPRYAPYDLALSDGGDRVFASLSQDGKDLAWRWPSTLPKPELDGSTATYVDAVPGGDLVVTATDTGFTHNIVLRERPGTADPGAATTPSGDPTASPTAIPTASATPTETATATSGSTDAATPTADAAASSDPVRYSIPITTDGAKLSETSNGGLSIDTKSGDMVTSAPGLVMWDSRTDASGDPSNVVPVDATVTQAGGTTPDGDAAGATPVLTITPNQDFLNDPNTVYPVTIDPTQTVTTNGDMWLQNTDPSNLHLGDTALHVGYNGTSVARTYLMFPTVLSGYKILSATLTMRNYKSLSCAGGMVYAARITSSWSTSNLSWSNQPNHTNVDFGVNNDAYGYTGCAGNWANFDVTNIVAGWSDGSFANYGLKVRANTENYTPSYREYRSTNDTTANQPPKLTITYDAKPTVTGLSVDPCVKTSSTCSTPLVADSTTPDLLATVSDTESATVTADFELRRSGTTTVIASGSDSVSSGQVAHFSVPPAPDGSEANLLDPGGSYEFRVAADDGNYQVWSGWTTFTVSQSPDAATALTLAEPLTIFDTGAVLSWTRYLDPSNAQSDDLVEYQVFRGCVALPSSGCASPVGSAFPAGGTGLTLVGTVDKDLLAFTDTSAVASSATEPATYRYWIGARTQDDVANKRNAQVATNSWQTTMPRQGRVRRILTALDGSTLHNGYDDTTLSQTSPTTVLSQPKDGAGSPGAYIQAGSANPNYGNERSVLDFDTSAIIPGLAITDAHLDLKQVGGGGTGTAGFELHSLTKDFDETAATWNNAAGTTTWTTAGGDFSTGVLATLTTDATAKSLSLAGSAGEVRGAVQGWVNTPSTNHGMILKAANEAGGAGQHWINIASGESVNAADRPRLVVENLRTAPDGTFSASTMQERFLPNTVTEIPVTITNTSNTPWPSTLQLAYRWAAVGGTADTSSFSSDRYVALGRALDPGESVTVTMRLRAPINSATGQKLFDYDLFLDLWTGSAWFSVANPYTTAMLTSDQRTQRLCTVVGTSPGGLLCPNRVVDQSGSTNLGLEQFYTYSGESTGGGGQLLTNLLTGNEIWSYDAFANPSVGPSMFVRATYNSEDNGTVGTIGDAGTGFGWSVQVGTLNRLGTALAPTGNNKEVALVDGDGTQHLWEKDDAASSGYITAYDRPPGVQLELSRDDNPATPAAQRWTFTRPDGTRFYFDDAGFPRSIVDRNGNTLTYNYTGAPAPTTLTSITDSKARTVASLKWTSGRLRSVTDISGRGMKLVYNGANQVTQIQDGGGFDPNASSGLGSYSDPSKVKSFGFTYTTATTSALLASTTDPRNATTTVDYYVSTDTYPADGGDSMPSSVTGWPKSVTDRTGRITALRYYDDDGSDGSNIRSTVTATDLNPLTTDDVTTYTADGFGRTLAIKDANEYAAGGSATTNLVWDADHNVSRLTQPNGATWRWLYDPNTGYPLKIWDAQAVKDGTAPRSLSYQAIGSAVPGGTVLGSITTPGGKTTSFGYDSHGNLTSVTDPLSRVTSYTYNADGTQATATNALSKTTSFTYNASNGANSGYPTRITPPVGMAPADFVYDVRGNVLTSSQTSSGSPSTTLTTTATYDGFGRPLTITTPGAQSGDRTKSTVYDLNDNATSITAPNGFATTTTYAADDQPLTRNYPRNSTSTAARQQTWTYDSMGRMISTTSPEGNRTSTVDDRTMTYSYDHLGQVTRMSQPWAGGSASAAAITQYEYDKVGNLTKSTDPRGNTTQAVFDLAGRPISAIDATGFATRTRYDLDSRVVAQVDQRGNVTTHSYDDAGEVLSTSVKHTPAGSPTQTWVSEFEYNATGNLTKSYRPRIAGSAKTLYNETIYDDNGRPTQQRAAFDAQGTAPVTYFEYNDFGRLTRQSAPTRAGSGSDWTNYTYYDSGDIKTSTDPTGIATSYKYNTLGLQTERVLTPSSGTGNRTMSWSYWPDGSLSGRDDNAAPATAFVTDNAGTAPVAAFTGTWDTATLSASKYGADYRTHAAAAASSDTATWSITPGTTGTYRLDVACPTPPSGGTATASASYQVTTNPGTGPVTTTKTLDQTTCDDDRTWHSLGSFTVAGGQAATVVLKPSADGIVVADAARLILLDNERAFNYTYDADGSQTRVDDNTPNARISTYTTDYDNVGRAVQNQELNGSAVRRTTTYTYDIASNPLTVLANRGAESNPNDVGNLASSTFTAYCYDTRNEVSTATTGTSASTELRRWKYTYDPTGAVSTLTKPASTDSLSSTNSQTCNSNDDPTGNVTKYRYYETGLLRSMEETNPRTNKVVASHYLWFNPDGDRTKDISHVQNADSSTSYIDQTATYAYTPTRQLAVVVKTGTNKAPNETYYYDAAGNVTSQSVNGINTSYTYGHNQLQTSTTSGVTSTQNYDGYGRLKSVSTPSATLMSYTYDGFDRLIGESKTIPGVASVTKSTGYDPFDRPTLQTVTKSGTTKKTRFNYLGLTKQVAVEEQPDSGGLWQASKTYNYGPDGRPLILINTPSTGVSNRRLYGYNPHGDTETLTDASGSNEGKTTATYRYTAYGSTESQGSTGEDKGNINPDAASVSDVVNPYRFNANRYDPTSGKYDMGFRSYDPGLNRFLSRDSFNGALDDVSLGTDPWNTNRYAFAGGNPVNGVELTGHAAVLPGGESQVVTGANPSGQDISQGGYSPAQRRQNETLCASDSSCESKIYGSDKDENIAGDFAKRVVNGSVAIADPANLGAKVDAVSGAVSSVASIGDLNGICFATGKLCPGEMYAQLESKAGIDSHSDSHLVGSLGFDIGTLFVGAGEIKAGATLADAADSVPLAERLFTNRHVGVDSPLFGHSYARGSSGLLNRTGSPLKAGWASSGEFGGGWHLRIGLGRNPQNLNQALRHVDFGSTHVPNDIANDLLAILRQLRGLG
jgi:RHS repeat-associated protein